MHEIWTWNSLGANVNPPFVSVSGKTALAGTENLKSFIKLAKNKKIVFLATLSPKHFLLPIRKNKHIFTQIENKNTLIHYICFTEVYFFLENVFFFCPKNTFMIHEWYDTIFIHKLFNIHMYLQDGQNGLETL